jgi:hypothetical protein
MVRRLWVGEHFSDLAKKETAAAPIVLEDADAGATGEKIFAEGSVEGGIDAIGDQDEVDIGVSEEGACLVGVGAANGVIVCRFMVIEESKDDREDLGVFADDQNIDGMGDGN